MRQSMRVCSTLLGITLAAVCSRAAAASTSVPNHEQVQAFLAAKLAAQLMAPLQRIPAGATVAVRDSSQHELARVVEDSLAAALARRGIEVWFAPAKSGGDDSTLAASWVVNLGVDQASFMVGPPSRGLFVFRGGRCGRQAIARLTAAFRPADRDQPVWSGSPAAAFADVIAAEQAAEYAESAPAWIAQALKEAPKPLAPRSGFLERVGVLGLIGGVVLIYAAGAN